MKVIILAAGNSAKMSGTIKCLIKNPYSGKTILQHLFESFYDCEIVVVVGYRAIEIMQEYPKIEYVLNYDWSVTAPSYSVGLALDDKPCYIIPGDILLNRELVEHLHKAPNDCVLTRRSENRNESATNFIVKDSIIKEAYVGSLRNGLDPEGFGIFKLSSPFHLKTMKENSLKHGNLFLELNLNYQNTDYPIYNLDISNYDITEFNSYLDYINFLNIYRRTVL